MQFTTIVSLFAVVSAVVAIPTDNNNQLEKRGFGCGIFSSDDAQCNFHCVNDVSINCSDGRKIKPYKGSCGGWASATCQCSYNTSC